VKVLTRSSDLGVQLIRAEDGEVAGVTEQAEHSNELADRHNEHARVHNSEPRREHRDTFAHWPEHAVQRPCDNDIECRHDVQTQDAEPKQTRGPMMSLAVRAAFPCVTSPFTATRYPTPESTDMSRSPTPAITLAWRIGRFVSILGPTGGGASVALPGTGGCRAGVVIGDPSRQEPLTVRARPRPAREIELTPLQSVWPTGSLERNVVPFVLVALLRLDGSECPSNG
jgi:hypothetical protein